MKPTIRQLEAFAAARNFEPLPDPPTGELDNLLDAFGAAKVRATGHGPANDLYAHLIECAFGPLLQAKFFIRFDLGVFVMLPYALAGNAWQLSVGHAELKARCAPLVKALEARQFEQIAFDAAMQPLSGTLLVKGFIDNTLMAYFFESP